MCKCKLLSFNYLMIIITTIISAVLKSVCRLWTKQKGKSSRWCDPSWIFVSIDSETCSQASYCQPLQEREVFSSVSVPGWRKELWSSTGLCAHSSRRFWRVYQELPRQWCKCDMSSVLFVKMNSEFVSHSHLAWQRCLSILTVKIVSFDLLSVVFNTIKQSLSYATNTHFILSHFGYKISATRKMSLKINTYSNIFALYLFAARISFNLSLSGYKTSKIVFEEIYIAAFICFIDV